MKNKYVGLTLFFLFALASFSFAQAESEEVGLMRSNGKIFVVMAVTLIILLGLVVFLVRLEKKIARLEKGA
jgi:hypothetical protein